MKDTEFFTLSAYETSAEAFFTALKDHHTDLVLDIRLHNSNQLCGFTKERDLAYLVPALTGAAYVHDVRLAPSPDLLKGYQDHVTDWDGYRAGYEKEMQAGTVKSYVESRYGQYRHVCLLGTATKKRRSHSEALLDLLQGQNTKDET